MFSAILDQTSICNLLMFIAMYSCKATKESVLCSAKRWWKPRCLSHFEEWKDQVEDLILATKWLLKWKQIGTDSGRRRNTLFKAEVWTS